MCQCSLCCSLSQLLTMAAAASVAVDFLTVSHAAPAVYAPTYICQPPAIATCRHTSPCPNRTNRSRLQSANAGSRMPVRSSRHSVVEVDKAPVLPHALPTRWTEGMRTTPHDRVWDGAARSGGLGVGSAGILPPRPVCNLFPHRRCKELHTSDVNKKSCLRRAGAAMSRPKMPRVAHQPLQPRRRCTLRT